MDNVFAYPDVKSVVICGDVHGEFRELRSGCVCVMV